MSNCEEGQALDEVIIMFTSRRHMHGAPRNESLTVPEENGRAKNRSNKDMPIVGGTADHEWKGIGAERPISKAYAEIDNDLARDNIENDLPDADLQDL